MKVCVTDTFPLAVRALSVSDGDRERERAMRVALAVSAEPVAPLLGVWVPDSFTRLAVSFAVTVCVLLTVSVTVFVASLVSSSTDCVNVSDPGQLAVRDRDALARVSVCSDVFVRSETVASAVMVAVAVCVTVRSSV